MDREMRIHYLQHVSFETPGVILEWAKQKGYPVTSTRFYDNTDVPGADQFDWLVVVGGPPWISTRKPNSPGSCLGAQIIYLYRSQLLCSASDFLVL